MAGCGSATRHSLPAGPGGVPILGAALKWRGPETNLEWTREYGPIYSVKIGPNQLVYLNTIELVEKYLDQQGHNFLGRPEGPAAIANGLLFGSGEKWQRNRQAFERALWIASITESYEDIIQQEADTVVSDLSKSFGQPVEVDVVLLPALTSRLVTLLTGERQGRYSADVQTLVAQMKNLEEVDLTSKSTQMFLKVKNFRQSLEAVSGRTIPDMFKMSEEMQSVIRGWIARRRSALHAAAPGAAHTNGAVLERLLTSEEFQNAQGESETELIQSVMDLFNGGVTSTLSALEFFILYLVHNQDVQVKVKDEIDRVLALKRATPAKGEVISVAGCGAGKKKEEEVSADGAGSVRVRWEDRLVMPYTRATLVEVLRLGSITPSSLPHVATQQVCIDDQYEIPKDVFVMASIFSLHRDPRYYKDPEVFRPERHLDQDGKFTEPKSYRPFGIGKRLCIGYHLAEVEIFLFMTRLLLAFRLHCEDPDNPPPFDTQMRVVRRLKPFYVVLQPWDTKAAC